MLIITTIQYVSLGSRDNRQVPKIIIEKEWEFSDVVEHDYSKAEVKDCLI
jgi:hypothetical protein